MLNEANYRPLIVLGIIGAGAAGVLGAALKPDQAVNIIGFCTMIAVGLFNLLRQAHTTQLAEEGVVLSKQAVDEAREDRATTARKVEEVKTDLAQSASTVAEKLDVLHDQGNSKWAEIKEELAAARAEIRALQEIRVAEAEARPPPG